MKYFVIKYKKKSLPVLVSSKNKTAASGVHTAAGGNIFCFLCNFFCSSQSNFDVS